MNADISLLCQDGVGFVEQPPEFFLRPLVRTQVSFTSGTQ
jgi:hypothetical protein